MHEKARHFPGHCVALAKIVEQVRFAGARFGKHNENSALVEQLVVLDELLINMQLSMNV